MPTSANCPKNPSDVRADVGIRAPILPLSQQPLNSIRSPVPRGGPFRRTSSRLDATTNPVGDSFSPQRKSGERGISEERDD